MIRVLIAVTWLAATLAEARWYDSETGTWLSRDDIGAAAYLQLPNELNPWQYAAGNPTRFTDPSGRCAIIPGSGDMSCFSADTWSLALQDRTRMGFVFTGYLQRKMAREGNENLAAVAGMTHMSASLAVTGWGDEQTFDHGERLEAFHSTNMLNPAYSALFHGNTMLDIDARRRAEGSYDSKTASAMAENSLYFALDVTGLYGVSRGGASWGQQRLGPIDFNPLNARAAMADMWSRIPVIEDAWQFAPIGGQPGPWAPGYRPAPSAPSQLPFVTMAAAKPPLPAQPANAGVWSSTNRKTGSENALDHFKKHGQEFGAKNALDYVRLMRDFIKKAGVLKKVRSNGETVYYDPASQTFAVTNAAGIPKTMFKPDPAIHKFPSNLDYFNAQ